MGNLVEVKFDTSEVIEVIDKIRAKGRNATRLMRDIAGIMHDAVEENFEKEGRPHKWADLAASTKRQRTRKGTWPGKILQARGKLAASVVEDYDGNNAKVGTNVKYARIHQFGGEIKHAARERIMHFRQVTRGQMTHGRPGSGDRFARAGKSHYAMRVMGKAHSTSIPARPFLHLEPSDLRRIVEAAKAFLQKR